MLSKSFKTTLPDQVDMTQLRLYIEEHSIDIYCYPLSTGRSYLWCAYFFTRNTPTSTNRSCYRLSKFHSYAAVETHLQSLGFLHA